MFDDRLSDRLRELVYPAFQAVVDSAGAIIYHEACLRTLATARPDNHVQLLLTAEATGFIDLIDHVIAAKAIEHAQHANAPVGVNASVFTIERNAESYLRLVATARRIPGGLVIEITETIESRNFGLLVDFVKEAKRLGGRIAIDDFGTGNFADEDIDALRPHFVKLAMPRVHDAFRSEQGRKWAREAVSRSEHVNATVIAEGIETEAQRELMERLGVGHFQGFLLSQPCHLLPRGRDTSSAAPRELPHNVTPLYRSEAL